MSWEFVSNLCKKLFPEEYYYLMFFCLTLMILCDAIDDVDTRAITRRLREDGSLIGVLSTDNSKTDEELLHLSKSWNIVGKDMSLGDYVNVF